MSREGTPDTPKLLRLCRVDVEEVQVATTLILKRAFGECATRDEEPQDRKEREPSWRPGWSSDGGREAGPREIWTCHVWFEVPHVHQGARNITPPRRPESEAA